MYYEGRRRNHNTALRSWMEGIKVDAIDKIGCIYHNYVW